MVQCRHVIALLGAIAWTNVQASPIEDNLVTPLGVEAPLTHAHPAYGGPPPANMVQPVIPLTMSTRDLTRNASAVHRHLEAGASADVARLEAHFGEKLVTNFDEISNKYKAYAVSPAPWPGSYWPAYRDSINSEVNDDEPSAAEKYARAFGHDVTKFMDGVSKGLGIDRYQYNRKCSEDEDCKSLNDGSVCAKRKGSSSGRCLGTWWGICHAWAPAAIQEPEGKCSVVKNNVTFRVNDLKALITAVYDGARVPVVFTGARYDGYTNDRDNYGRYKELAERDLGPGFFHIAVANILGRFKKSFVVDQDATAQVWNQPVQGYNFKTMTTMKPSEASQKYFDTPTYLFNTGAVKVAYVNMEFSYMEESGLDGPLVESGHAVADTKTKAYEYLLELDARNNIIGGEWLKDSQVDHPDFLWFGTRKPLSGSVTELNLDYDKISEMLKQSVACSAQPTTPTPTTATIAPNTTAPVPTTTAPNTTAPVPTTTAPNTTAPVPTTTAPNTTVPVPTTTAPNTTAPVPTTTAPNTTAPVPTTTAPNTTAPVPTTTAPASDGSCGNDQVGAKSCPAGQYCQPLNSTLYVCRPLDAKCGKQEIGIDYYGDDLETYWVTIPDQCCQVCFDTPDCKAYTFVNHNEDGHAYCYLKKGAGKRQVKLGAVSAQIVRADNEATTIPNATTPAPNTTVPVTTPVPTTIVPNATTPAPTTTSPGATVRPPTEVPAPNTTAPSVTTPAPNTTAPSVTTPAPNTTAPLPTTTSPSATVRPPTTDPTPAPNATTPNTTAPPTVTVAPTPTPTPIVAGSCGNDQVGAKACPSGQYCQPINSTSYQCQSLDAKCGKQETGIDYYGDDIETYWVTRPEQCCDVCFKTPTCKAYTLVFHNDDGHAYCYLKKGTGKRVAKVGAVSATIVRPNDNSHAGSGSASTTCENDEWAACGNSFMGAQCCKAGNYCQPWDSFNFQCVPKPDKCSKQFPQIDFDGANLKTIYGTNPWKCCDKCAKTIGCKGYTYVNDNLGRPACYLKKSIGKRKFRRTAVSGIVG